MLIISLIGRPSLAMKSPCRVVCYGRVGSVTTAEVANIKRRRANATLCMTTEASVSFIILGSPLATTSASMSFHNWRATFHLPLCARLSPRLLPQPC